MYNNNRIHYLINKSILQISKNKINFIKNKKIYNALFTKNKTLNNIDQSNVNTYKRHFHSHRHTYNSNSNPKQNPNNNNNDILFIIVASSLVYYNSKK